MIEASIKDTVNAKYLGREEEMTSLVAIVRSCVTTYNYSY